MSNKKRAIGIRCIILGSIALLICLVITFGQGIGLGFVPTWAQIYEFSGLGGVDNSDYMAVLDVGDASCAVICSNGTCTLIDTGGVGDNGTAVVRFLKSRDIKQIDYMVLSHHHGDHIGGAEKVLDNFPVGIVLVMPLMGDEEDSELVPKVIESAEKSGAQIKKINQGVRFSAGDFSFEILMAKRDAKEENDRSAVVLADNGAQNMLFMGDVSAKAERELISLYPDLSADILVVGHHGSKTSTCAEFLDAIRPEYAAVSCGTRWATVPDGEVISRLSESGAQIKRTDINSNIYYYFEEGGVRVETER